MENRLVSCRKITGIMAATSTGVIGKDNRLPWNYPEEFNHFKETTNGHVVIVGRKTFDGTKLKFFSNRFPIILSQDQTFKSSIGKIARNLKECLDLIQHVPSNKEIFMIGGAQVAHLFLEANLLSYFILSKIHYPYIGDISINIRLLSGWKEQTINSTQDFDIVHLKNI